MFVGILVTTVLGFGECLREHYHLSCAKLV